MSRIPLLPVWVMPPTMPSIYESESMTAIESAARVYGAMREMIDDYNKFAAEVNVKITMLYNTTDAENAEIRESMQKLLQSKFCDLDAKMGEIKAQLHEYTKNYVEEIRPNALPEVTTADNNKLLGVVNGNWMAVTATGMQYDPDTESLIFNVIGG